jgi:methylated-DNA-protein-cysteine methyltransferase-like protein
MFLDLLRMHRFKVQLLHFILPFPGSFGKDLLQEAASGRIKMKSDASEGGIALEPFSLKAIQVISNIPSGSVATYGQIARLCGNPRAARQVVRILVACSRGFDLPWHRVVGAPCRITLPHGEGFDYQSALLRSEGVEVGEDGYIDGTRFLWKDRESS